MENEIDTLQDAFERYLEEHSDELEEDSEEEQVRQYGQWRDSRHCVKIIYINKKEKYENTRYNRTSETPAI